MVFDFVPDEEFVLALNSEKTNQLSETKKKEWKLKPTILIDLSLNVEFWKKKIKCGILKNKN